MRWNCAITYEHPSAPPETIRVAVQAGGPAAAAARAVRSAKRAEKGRRYTSVVILLEKAAEESDTRA